MNNTEKFDLIKEYFIQNYFSISNIDVNDRPDDEKCFAVLKRGEYLGDDSYILLYMEYYGKEVSIDIKVKGYYQTTNLWNVFKNNDILFFKYFFMIGIKLLKIPSFYYFREDKKYFRDGIILVNIIHYKILPIELVQLLKTYL